MIYDLIQLKFNLLFFIMICTSRTRIQAYIIYYLILSYSLEKII